RRCALCGPSQRKIAPGAAVPEHVKLAQVVATFPIQPKTFHDFVPQKQVPLVRVPMLKETPALEVMLAHRPRQPANRVVYQRKALGQLSERQMEGLLVTVQITVVEVRVLIEPEVQPERLPTSPFSQHDLSAL